MSNTDEFTLHTMATEADRLHQDLHVPSHTAPVPTVAAVSTNLRQLGQLITDLAFEVRDRTDQEPNVPSIGHGRATAALARAVAPASRAVTALGSVYVQLVFLDQTGFHVGANYSHAQLNAFMVVGDRLDDARRALADTATGLRKAAGDAGPPIDRIDAARSRSTLATASTTGLVHTPGLPPGPAEAPSSRSARSR